MNAEAHLFFNDRQNPKNWQTDFPHENGNYLCKCVECKESFIGHKHRFLCRVCSEKEGQKQPFYGDGLTALQASEKLVYQLEVFNKEPTIENLNFLDIFKD